MGRIKFFEILACATLFSTALSVNALVNRSGGDDRFHTSNPFDSLRVTSRTDNRVVTADGILLGDSAVTRDGVVLGDRSIFCDGISSFADVKRERGRFLRDGVVLGNEFVRQTSSNHIAAKR